MLLLSTLQNQADWLQTTAKEKEQSNSSYSDVHTTKPKEAYSSWHWKQIKSKKSVLEGLLNNEKIIKDVEHFIRSTIRFWLTPGKTKASLGNSGLVL